MTPRPSVSLHLYIWCVCHFWRQTCRKTNSVAFRHLHLFLFFWALYRFSTKKEFALYSLKKNPHPVRECRNAETENYDEISWHLTLVNFDLQLGSTSGEQSVSSEPQSGFQKQTGWGWGGLHFPRGWSVFGAAAKTRKTSNSHTCVRTFWKFSPHLCQVAPTLPLTPPVTSAVSDHPLHVLERQPWSGSVSGGGAERAAEVLLIGSKEHVHPDRFTPTFPPSLHPLPARGVKPWWSTRMHPGGRRSNRGVGSGEKSHVGGGTLQWFGESPQSAGVSWLHWSCHRWEMRTVMEKMVNYLSHRRRVYSRGIQDPALLQNLNKPFFVVTCWNVFNLTNKLFF